MVRAIRKWYEQFELDDLEERDQTGSLRTFFKKFRSIFLMSIGYGVGPANHEERLYTMFVAITGVIIFAFAMGNVTTIMQNKMSGKAAPSGRVAPLMTSKANVETTRRPRHAAL